MSKGDSAVDTAPECKTYPVRSVMATAESQKVLKSVKRYTKVLLMSEKDEEINGKAADSFPVKYLEILRS